MLYDGFHNDFIQTFFIYLDHLFRILEEQRLEIGFTMILKNNNFNGS